MSFKINGTTVEREISLGQNLTVGDLLREKKIDAQKVVVEYNTNILSRNLFDKTHIKNGDNIEVLSFVGGG
jgi:sulfur carrier protein